MGLLEEAHEFLGASHGGWVPNRQLVGPRGTFREGLIPGGEEGRRARTARNEGAWAGATGGTRRRDASAQAAGIPDKLPMRHPTRAHQNLSEPRTTHRS